MLVLLHYALFRPAIFFSPHPHPLLSVHLVKEGTENNLQWRYHSIVMENEARKEEYERHGIYGVCTNCIRQCPQKENFKKLRFFLLFH